MIPPSVIAYYVINCFNILALTPLVLTVFLSKHISRHPTIPNNMIVWIMQSISTCLLLFTGYSQSDNIPRGFCKFQSSLQYGAPPALAAAALTVVARVWFLTWSVGRHTGLTINEGQWARILSVALPYVVWAVVSAVCGGLAGDNVRRVIKYCASDNATANLIANAATAVLTLIACVLQIWAIIIVGGRYRVSRRLGPLETGSTDTATFVRVCAFWVLILIGFILSIVVLITGWSQTTADIALSALGIGCFLVFGTQGDILQVWGIRKQSASYYTGRSSAARRTVGSLGGGAGMVNRETLHRHRPHISEGPVTKIHPRDASDSTDSLDYKGPHTLGRGEMKGQDIQMEIVTERFYDDELSSPPKAHMQLGRRGEALAPTYVDLEAHPRRGTPPGFPIIAYGSDRQHERQISGKMI